MKLVDVASLDVPCACCGARAGVQCRAWSGMLAPIARVHRARAERRREVVQMHTAAAALFGEWPTEAEIEMLARLGDGADRDRATKLLSLIEATGYDGELFVTT